MAETDEVGQEARGQGSSRSLRFLDKEVFELAYGNNDVGPQFARWTIRNDNGLTGERRPKILEVLGSDHRGRLSGQVRTTWRTRGAARQWNGRDALLRCTGAMHFKTEPANFIKSSLFLDAWCNSSLSRPTSGTRSGGCR